MVIGTITTYLGDEIPGLQGAKVCIFAVLRGAVRPDVDVDAEDFYVNEDATLARLGGVTAEDCVDVAPLRADGSTSFVHVAPRAVDLECFTGLKTGAQ
ncbi:hypothetical protein JQX13_46930 [Archangium violaceum]|uniref:hypothetical protein n=1 Tax=Archangium violaceum TaxID=83451 RepID=UPI00193B4887|nr:hypothetical protein [Archangium violaceum]QRK07469.1 hypothetical protein JQX13_46930 [Archangium violaceum]